MRPNFGVFPKKEGNASAFEMKLLVKRTATPTHVERYIEFSDNNHFMNWLLFFRNYFPWILFSVFRLFLFFDY